jgi:hypothetical protein
LLIRERKQAPEDNRAKSRIEAVRFRPQRNMTPSRTEKKFAGKRFKQSYSDTIVIVMEATRLKTTIAGSEK